MTFFSNSTLAFIIFIDHRMFDECTKIFHELDMTYFAKMERIAVVNLHDTDERTMHAGASTQMNLGLREEGNIVSVRKVVKAIPVDMIMVQPMPGQISVSEYYVKKKFQDTILYYEDRYMTITLPNDDSRRILFAIRGTRFNKEYGKDFGRVYRVTPETSFDIVNEKELHIIRIL